jgi:Transglutaminase-like superfamily
MQGLIRSSLVYIAFLILSGCAGSTSSPAALKVGVDDSYQIPKQIRYSFTLSNTTGNLLESTEFWTYLPVPQTSHQKVKKVVANFPFQQKLDELGNSSIYFKFKDIPPYGSKIVSITVDLMMTDQPVSLPVGDKSRFLTNDQYIEINDARIISLAKQLVDVSTAITVQKDYEWVAQNIKSETYIAEDLGASYAIENRKGDCTEFSYLLTALYRVQQIHARPIGGYTFSGNGIMKATDYHNWTEFYFNDAWHIADAQKGNFVERQSDYVAMRIIATGGSAAVASQRFSYAGEGLRVEMN